MNLRINTSIAFTRDFRKHREAAVRWFLRYFSPSADPGYKYRRVAPLFVAADLVMVIVVAANALRLGVDRDLDTLLLYVFLGVAIGFAHYCFLKGRDEAAVRGALWICMTMLSIVSWTGQGLHDSSIFGYGILLVYAGILETRRQYWMMAACIIANIALLGLARTYDLVHYRLDFRFSDVIDFICAYFVLGYSIDTLAQDLRTMLDRYLAEN